MHFETNHIYYVYNRGNEKQTIFSNHENYIFFLKKIRMEWLSYCEIFAYCLMPNHFHFVLLPNEKGCEAVVLKDKETHMQNLSKAIGKTLSSYTLAFNKNQKRTGNLFQKKTKAKLITLAWDARSNYDYLATCISFIHQNPKAAGLVETAEDWMYSPLPDYAQLRKGTLCSQAKLFEITGFSKSDFLKKDGFEKEAIESMF